MTRRYVIYDVFSDRGLAGNPLAVVLDTDGLDKPAMQAIAREFNLSETTFVSPPENPLHRARVHIFTQTYEMPFAGHPTVGTAVALAELDGSADAALLVLEENIGPVRCAVRRGQAASFAEFDLAQLPKQLPFAVDPMLVGAALGLQPQDVGFDNHSVSLWTAGVPYIVVPVANRAALADVAFDNGAWLSFCPMDEKGKPASAYAYCRDPQSGEVAFHARMFVPGSPSYEDPATGSALAAVSGALVEFDQPVDGIASVVFEQGADMGRPSRLQLESEVVNGKLTAARIGGHAVKVAEGSLFV